jgi:DNA-binding GntR family transcriptional regulator
MALDRASGVDLTGRAYRSLRRMIESGAMPPRRKLSHRTLSRDLKIGRSPVRDALLRLEAEGLIEHRPGSGIYLREISPAELRHVYELRILNEPHFAGEAARHATATQLARLERLCDRMESTAGRPDLARWLASRENVRGVARLDIEFHKTVLEASANPVAARIFSSPNILALSFAWDLFFMKPEWLAEVAERSCAGHRAVERAIRRRDTEAAATAMRSHLVWGRREVPEHYASLHAPALPRRRP